MNRIIKESLACCRGRRTESDRVFFLFRFGSRLQEEHAGTGDQQCGVGVGRPEPPEPGDAAGRVVQSQAALQVRTLLGPRPVQGQGVGAARLGVGVEPRRRRRRHRRRFDAGAGGAPRRRRHQQVLIVSFES